MTPKLASLPFALLLAAAPIVACTLLEPSLGADVAPNTDDAGDEADAGPMDAEADVDGAEVDAAPTPVSFKDDIRPLMNRTDFDPTGHGCKKCHYSTQPSHIGLDLGGVDLATLGSLRSGGNTTKSGIVVAGDPKHSYIVQKLRGTYSVGARMPFSGPPYWSEDQIALVERWILEGAHGEDSE